MKNFWLFVTIAALVGVASGWTMNYTAVGHREAYFGEITMDGTVTADNVMEKLKEYHSESTAVAELPDGDTHDFGAMAPGTTGKHSFVIKNAGDDPLTLELGASTCKCTLGSLKDNVLEPGQTTSVDLEWTVTADKKTFQQSAEVRTNDPGKPGLRLVVLGLVIRDVEFEPSQVTFGEVLAGESFDFSTVMYSYFDTKIEPLEVIFGSEDLNKLADSEFEEFAPSESDGVHQRARQGFRIKTTVRPGLRQGPMVTSLTVKFRKPDEIVADGQASSEAGDDPAVLDSESFYARAECAGRVVGSLAMINNAKLRSTDGGGYIWNLGRIGPDDKLSYSAFVSLKGSEQGETNLTIGETYPSDVVQAKLAEPIGRGKMQLFRLTVTLKPGQEDIDLLGKNKVDFGWVRIESDNPKVSPMKVAVKAFIQPRP